MFDFPNAPAINDLFSPAAGPTWQWNGVSWVQVAPNLLVQGPVSAQNNYIPRWDGTSGKLLQDSLVQIDDTGNMYFPAGVYTYVGGTVAWVSQYHFKGTSNVQTTTALYLGTILAGGSFGFSPVYYGNSSVIHIGAYASNSDAASTYIPRNTNFSSAGSAYFALGQGPTAGASTAYVSQQYVTTSPPYDMGDGEVPLFSFMLMNKDGTIRGTSVAPDPPWAYNGPTSIKPDVIRDGKFYRRVKDVQLNAKMSPRERVIAHTEAPWTEIEIDMAMKMKDAAQIPHPWIGDDSVINGEATPILLDPMSPLMHELAAWHDAGHSVPDLLHKNDQPGDIKIGTTTLKRAGPKGLRIVSAKWR